MISDKKDSEDTSKEIVANLSEEIGSRAIASHVPPRYSRGNNKFAMKSRGVYFSDLTILKIFLKPITTNKQTNPTANPTPNSTIMEGTCGNK